MTTGNAAPVHPRLTTKQTPDIDLIQTFIAKNGVKLLSRTPSAVRPDVKLTCRRFGYWS